MDKTYSFLSKVEIVNEFTYLGVTFSSTGSFSRTAEMTLKKVKTAIAKVKQIMSGAKMQPWEARERILTASIIPVASYAAEIWSLKHLEKLEAVSGMFYKSIYNWQLKTPYYIIRKETGTPSVGATILKKALNWWNKIDSKPDTSYVKICHRRVIALNKVQPNFKQFNWHAQMKEILAKV